jgi:ribulose-bisphosphate carboxylase small chain
MMRNAVVITFFTFLAEVTANESNDNLADELVDRLVDRLFNRVLGTNAMKIPSLMQQPRPQQLPRMTQGIPSTKEVAAQAISPAHSMQAYSPYNGKKFETLSYLPPLSNDAIMRQIRFMLANNWAPALEFSDDGDVYLNTRMGPGYYDNRYWSLYKLPMFGCTDPAEVVREIEACKREFPNAKIRVMAFDSNKQVQAAAFIVAK